MAKSAYTLSYQSCIRTSADLGTTPTSASVCTNTHHSGAELAGCGLFLIMIVLGGIAGGCPPGEGKLPGGAMLSGPVEAL